MLASLGVLALILGAVLVALSFFRLSVSGRHAGRWLLASALLLVTGIVLLHVAQGRTDVQVPIAITLVLTGVVLFLVGGWHALWGPVAARNARFGARFVFGGLAAIVLGILLVAAPSVPFDASRHRIGHVGNDLDIGEILSHRVGGIPFGAFALIAFLALNGLGLRNGLAGKKLLGANLFLAAMLAGLYSIGPSLFPVW